MVLLEVVCTVHESVQQENAKTPLIVCARCDRNKESKEKDVEHNGTLVDVGHGTCTVCLQLFLTSKH